MAYGFILKDTSGVTIYDSTSVTWLQIGFFIAPANTTTSRTYVDADQFSEVITQQWFISTPPDDQEAYAHVITLSNNNTSVNVSGGNQTQGILILGR